MAMRIICHTPLSAMGHLFSFFPDNARIGSSEVPSQPVAFTEDATDGGLGEMGGEDQCVGFGCVVHRPLARLPGGLWELAEYRVPVWPHELQRMVHHVAPEQRLFAPGIKADAGVVNTVTEVREKGKTLRRFRAVHNDLLS